MTNDSLAELLAAWLPGQRWFAGSRAAVRAVAITADCPLATGDRELRLLIVDVTTGDVPVSYQVLVGTRPSGQEVAVDAVIGELPGGRVAYEAMSDPDLAAILQRGIASNLVTGPLRFLAERAEAIDTAAPARRLPAATSNTSVVFGDQAILKVLRRPFAGVHPDLEIPTALARAGSRLVAAPLGWIELADAADEPMVTAIMSEFFPDAADGWSLAAASLTNADPDFTALAAELGTATAQLHAQLAAAFGADSLPPTAMTDLAQRLAAELDQAIDQVAELAEHQVAIRHCYAELAKLATPVPIQRIHGDYHLAQVLRVAGRWVILDFEGEPSVPLAQRRAFASALRDVAGMLRSFDYAARHQLLNDPGRGLRSTAATWVKDCQDAFCSAYGEATGLDPRLSGPLLRALILQKAVYEAVYEARHRPSWLPIPLHAIAEAVDEVDG